MSNQDNRLQGRVAFVTGAGSGIGAATAKRLAEAGAAVFVTDVDAASAERTAAEIRAAGGRSQAAEHDVTDEAQWERVVGLCVREFGGLNVLVNNAGIQRTGEFSGQSLDTKHREMAINVGGIINGMHFALPGMLERNRGHIVNLSSMAGKMTVPGAAVYTASKFAVATLSRTVRAEIAHTGVTITTILPSAVETELAAGLDLRGVPKATPEEIAVEIVASCQHGKPEVTLPKWLFPVGTIEQALPEKLGNWVKRTVGAQKRISADTPQSRKYQERLSRF